MFTTTPWGILDFLVRFGLILALIGGGTFLLLQLAHYAMAFHEAGMARLEAHGLTRQARHARTKSTVG